MTTNAKELAAQLIELEQARKELEEARRDLNAAVEYADLGRHIEAIRAELQRLGVPGTLPT